MKWIWIRNEFPNNTLIYFSIWDTNVLIAKPEIYLIEAIEIEEDVRPSERQDTIFLLIFIWEFRLHAK